VTLPSEINLGDAAMAHHYEAASVELKGKTHHPAPLVFYAAVLKGAPHPQLAARFVDWLGSAEARAILTHYYYDEPGNAPRLTH
jgi:molybdate/tungstate transport system substrate-binding protein